MLSLVDNFYVAVFSHLQRRLCKKLHDRTFGKEKLAFCGDWFVMRAVFRFPGGEFTLG